MANPYVITDKVLNLIPGGKTAVGLKDYKPPTPPIRQLPLPAILIPTMKKGK